jgi:hypothetical protein
MLFKKPAFVTKTLSLTIHLPAIHGGSAADFQPTQMLVHVAALEHDQIA